MKLKVEISGRREELPAGALSGRVPASQCAAMVELVVAPIRVGPRSSIGVMIDQGKKYGTAIPA